MAKLPKLDNFYGSNLAPEQGRRDARARGLQGQSDQFLSNPGNFTIFRDMYADTANAIAAPAMRDFQNTLAVSQANTAARFGGNASSEEARVGYNTSDLFSRNLSESLARLAPQAIGQGMQYGGMLMSNANAATGQADDIRQMIYSSIINKPRGGGFLSGLGKLAGAGLGFALGGPAGAKIGYGAGSALDRAGASDGRYDGSYG